METGEFLPPVHPHSLRQSAKPPTAVARGVQHSVNGLSVHLSTGGRGRPFLMLHGSPGDGSRLKRQVDPLFRRRRGWWRVYPDMPGHGQTHGSGRIRNIDDYLDVLLALTDQLFVGGRFVLGGFSFGAYLALGLARKRPGKIEGLLLSAPEVNFSPREERRERSARVPPLRSTKDPHWDDYVEDTDWLQALPFRDLSFNLYRPSRRTLAPTLFLFGRQDASFRYEEYRKLLPDFPRATYAVLDGVGHALWATPNTAIEGLVHDWLERVEEGAPRPPVAGTFASRAGRSSA